MKGRDIVEVNMSRIIDVAHFIVHYVCPRAYARLFLCPQLLDSGGCCSSVTTCILCVLWLSLTCGIPICMVHVNELRYGATWALFSGADAERETIVDVDRARGRSQ